MKDYISDFHFMINGPGSADDKSRRLFFAIEEIKDITSSGLFAGDCLVTWAKSLSFLEDGAFVESINRQLDNNLRLSNHLEHNRVLRGILWRKHVMCWAAEYCLRVDGDYAEVGCYMGDSVKVIIDYTNFRNTNKTYWLYDMFDNDGTISEKFAQHSSTMYQEVVESFRDIPNVRVIKGKVPESFSQGRPFKIAFLHVDMNNAPSERAALEELYESVAPSGIIIFDDYGWVQYRPQKDTIDQFLGKYGRRVLELPTGQGFFIK
jgi:O-methyltransferase